MKVTNKFVLFWGDYLGNWTPLPEPIKLSTMDSRFRNPNESALTQHSFITSEHLFMYLKAAYFKDWEIAKKIENAPDPKEAKKLGRLVKNFSEEEWKKVRYEIMFNTVYRRASVGDKFKEMITKPEWRNLEFVEASPYDRVWGIGLSQNSPRSEAKETWEGLNLLGQALCELRTRILWDEWIRTKNLREFHEDLIWCPSIIQYWFPVGDQIKMVYMRWRWDNPWSIEICTLKDPQDFESWDLIETEDITEKIGFFTDEEYKQMEEKVVEYLKNTYPDDNVADSEIIRKDWLNWTGTPVF